jgi:hypothetical protein
VDPASGILPAATQDEAHPDATGRRPDGAGHPASKKRKTRKRR